jgi:hypothetical protein
LQAYEKQRSRHPSLTQFAPVLLESAHTGAKRKLTWANVLCSGVSS